jgi:hypothetical protein
MHAGDLPPLAQRLERRKQATLLQPGTIDSWDFPTTLFHPSPTQTVFHRSPTNLDGRKSIDEWDEIMEDEQTGAGALAEDDDGPKLGFESLSSKPSTSAVSPTVASTPSLPSAPSEPPVSPPPNRSLWHRIGIRKSGHGKEASESRSTFINSMLQRGKGGRGIMA